MQSKIKIGRSPTLGIRGVLATKDIKKGALIEACPAIFIPIKEEKHLDKTVLWKYYFEWNKKFDVIVLGLGSVYNHADSPNATFRQNYKNKTLNYYALSDIKKGAEIFIDYKWDPKSKQPFHKILDFDKHLSDR